MSISSLLQDETGLRPIYPGGAFLSAGRTERFRHGRGIVRRQRGEREGFEGTDRSQTEGSCCSQKVPPLLMLPDDALQSIVLRIIGTPDNSGVLADRSLQHLEYALRFAVAHPRLFHALRSAVHTLIITKHDSITECEFVMISAGLRSLSISNGSLTTHFLDCTVTFPCPLLRSLELDNVTVPEDSFTTLIQNSKLTSLTLSYITLFKLSTVLTAIAPFLSKLQTLHLSGLSSLAELPLISICTSAHATLRDLSLRYLRHFSLTDDFFEELASILSSLTKLCIEDVRHASTTGITTFATQFAGSLEELQLRGMSIRIDDVYTLVSKMPFLQHLAIQCPRTWIYSIDPDTLVSAYLLNARSIHVVDLHAIPSLRDSDVSALVSGLKKLTSLSLRSCSGAMDSAMHAVALSHSKSLCKIDLRGTRITDAGIAALGQCNKLREVFLGGGEEFISYNESVLFDPRGVTNDGMDTLLRGCGRALRSFLWQSPRTVNFEVFPVGIGGLSGKLLAKSIGKFCPSILRVEVNWLRPHPSLGKERAECDLAFFKLDETLPFVSIFLDQHPL